ncbi:putative peptidase C1-like protein, partial [Trichinella pseudospiralis]
LDGCKDSTGATYPPGGPYRINCNTCSCIQVGNKYEFQCRNKTVCLIQEDILERMLHERNSWTSANYSTFWGKTLDEGFSYRLGTLLPEKSVKNMNEILIEMSNFLPESFDARERWPSFIHPVRDQGDCASSWAFSTTAVSADRLAIQSGGKFYNPLSVQQLLSCNQARQRGCNGGYLDRAWWYIRKFGVVSDECYTYTSGKTNQPGECHIPRTAYLDGEIRCPSGSTDNRVYKMTPPYRISTNQHFWYMKISLCTKVAFINIFHMQVIKDLLMQDLDTIHWGVDHSTGVPIKYWLCANSWGEEWGENGLFRIVRGENHCDIESFIIGAWGKGSKKRRRKFKVLRKLRHLHRRSENF